MRFVTLLYALATTNSLLTGIRSMHSTALHAVSSEPQVFAVLPELVVFDLDQCLWSPEMYTLDEIPTKTLKGRLGERGEGVVGVYSGYETIRLFPGALEALQEIWLGTYPGMRIAAASSADTPRAVQIGRAAMGLLEVLPGVTVRQVFGRGWEGMGTGFEGNMQIGRTPPLSSDKAATHFPLLRAATGVAYPGMLFFDDCGWGDHCGKVEKGCEGVVAVRTPRGLGSQEWRRGLQTYAQRNS